MSLTVACVNHSNYLGMGARYVDTLRAMVARNLSLPHEFVCLEDVGPLTGYWSKIELFRPGRFAGRVLYFDLDSVIVGPLDELAQTKGIIDLADWGWLTHTFNSSVMVWDGGEHEDVFTQFGEWVPKAFEGDQDWMTHLGGWQVLPSKWCRSYRYDCVKTPPKGCKVSVFHGLPKPHEVADGWVSGKWVM